MCGIRRGLWLSKCQMLNLIAIWTASNDFEGQQLRFAPPHSCWLSPTDSNPHSTAWFVDHQLELFMFLKGCEIHVQTPLCRVGLGKPSVIPPSWIGERKLHGSRVYPSEGKDVFPRGDGNWIILVCPNQSMTQSSGILRFWHGCGTGHSSE